MFLLPVAGVVAGGGMMDDGVDGSGVVGLCDSNQLLIAVCQLIYSGSTVGFAGGGPNGLSLLM